MGDCAPTVCLSPSRELSEDQNDADPFAPQPQPLRNQNNYRIADRDGVGLGSLRQKCRGNLEAIALLKSLEQDHRQPDDEEKKVLVRYVGWGGLPQMFDSLNAQWAEVRGRLESLMTVEEMDSARASTLNAHYTAPLIIRAIYALLQVAASHKGHHQIRQNAISCNRKDWNDVGVNHGGCRLGLAKEPLPRCTVACQHR